jgi:hypothetical protein
MNSGNVPPVLGPLLEDDFRTLVAATLRRLLLSRRPGALAYLAGCEERTIANALNGRNSLSGRALMNLLLADGSALDELLAHFGLKAVPSDGQSGVDHAALMAGAAGFTATVAEAMADGRVDHREAALIAERARTVRAQMDQVIAAHDRGKLN